MGLLKDIKEYNRATKALNLLNLGNLYYPDRDEDSIKQFVDLLSNMEDKDIFDFDYTITLFVANLDARIFADEIYEYEDDSEIPADDFLAIRCGAIAMGENYYLDVKGFTKKLDEENKFSELLTLPSRAWAIKNGKSQDEYPYVSPNKVETFSDKEAWKPNKENLSLEARMSVLMEEKDQLRYFAKKAVQNEAIYTAIEKTDDEKAAFLVLRSEIDYSEIIPIWPSVELANVYFKSVEDDAHRPVEIDLFDFLDDLIPDQLCDNSYLPAPFYYLDTYLQTGWSSLKRAIIKELLCGQSQKNPDPRVVYNALGRGEMGMDSASYALKNLIDNKMNFDERELKAFSGAATLKTVATYAINGWPTNCDICDVDIDYSAGWDVAFNQRIVCEDCFEKYEKVSMATRIILDDEAIEVLKQLEENEFDAKKNIDILRSTFAQNKDWRVDKISKPGWLIDDSPFPMFDEAQALYSEGKIVYGSILMANSLLSMDYEYGISISNPGYVIYSMNPYYDENPNELLLLAEKIYSYRYKNIVPFEMQIFVELMEHENDSYYNIQVPLEMTDGREVFVTSVLFQRNHLPLLKIGGRLLPVFADSENLSTCLPVPKRHFNPEMMFFVATPEDDEDDYDDEDNDGSFGVSDGEYDDDDDDDDENDDDDDDK